MTSPYIPNNDADREIMLGEIGVNFIDDLFEEVPREFLNVPFNLPLPLSEMELTGELARVSDLNASTDEYSCFLGAGYYRHFIPGIVHHIIGRSEFYTAYTPYQAEISQGTLNAIYDYQSLICQLTGMDVSNAGMYDGSTAAAEAALMACRLTNRSQIAILSSVNPRFENVIETYSSGRDIAIKRVMLSTPSWKALK